MLSRRRAFRSSAQDKELASLAQEEKATVAESIRALQDQLLNMAPGEREAMLEALFGTLLAEERGELKRKLKL